MYEHLPNQIVYVRHPQCLHNIAHDDALKKGIENRKSPLTPLGCQQRDITAEYLRTSFQEFDAVFATTFLRTHTIPEAAGFGKLLQINSLLDERSMGVWHEIPRVDMICQYPNEETQLKKDGYYAYVAPGGESCLDVERRHKAFLAEPKLLKGTKSVLISGHGIAGLCFRKVLLDGTVEDWHRWDRLGNASVTVYERRGETFKCVLYNHIPWRGLIEDGGGTEA